MFGGFLCANFIFIIELQFKITLQYKNLINSSAKNLAKIEDIKFILPIINVFLINCF